jgi:hypothetical protein
MAFAQDLAELVLAEATNATTSSGRAKRVKASSRKRKTSCEARSKDTRHSSKSSEVVARPKPWTSSRPYEAVCQPRRQSKRSSPAPSFSSRTARVEVPRQLKQLGQVSHCRSLATPSDPSTCQPQQVHQALSTRPRRVHQHPRRQSRQSHL